MTQPLQGLDVLLVEDDFAVLMDVKMLLEDAGARVSAAASAEQGALLSAKAYHAAILGDGLPEHDIYPVADRLTAQRTPVIFHSDRGKSSGLGKRFPAAIAISRQASEAQLLDTICGRVVAA